MRVRAIVAASALWILIALGIVCWEYLFQDPLAKHYFWRAPEGGRDLFATPEQLARALEPRLLQIAFVLFFPLAALWGLGWLATWAKRGDASGTRVGEDGDVANPKTPYPWGSVAMWTSGAFVAGLVVVQAPSGSSLANTVSLKMIGGVTLGLSIGIVVGIYKLFRRR